VQQLNRSLAGSRFRILQHIFVAIHDLFPDAGSYNLQTLGR
jgi:hypothetical protein